MPDQEVVPPCPVEDVAICAVCNESTDDCSCSNCGDCGARTSNICANCFECFACCSCAVCTNRICGARVGEVCSHCNECSDGCCNCGTCDAWGCNNLFDPDQDEYICSNCHMCEGNHCGCENCNLCGETFASVCSNCSRCTDSSSPCCTCVICTECDEPVRFESLCTDCERCEDCGCECEEDEEEDSDSIPSPGVTLPPDTAHSHTGLTRFDRFCWGTVDGRRSVVHVYADAFYDETCHTCHTCRDHCRGNIACSHPSGHSDGTVFHDVCPSCLACPSHCYCLTCYFDNSHKIKEGSMCSGCGNCSTHCACPKCATCASKTKTCPYCNQCPACCVSEASLCGASGSRSYPIPYRENPLIFHTPKNLLGYKKNPSRRFVGVEIEVNNTPTVGRGKGRPLHNTLDKWGATVCSDGSIGSQPDAFEMNIMPAMGDMFIDQLEEVCAGLNIMGIKPGENCGIHVHVNSSDLRGDDLKKVIDIYVKVERALFDLCLPYRLNHQYSVPCGNNYKSMGKTGKEIRSALLRGLFGVDTTQRPNNEYDSTARLKGRDKHSVLRNKGVRIAESKGNGPGRLRYRALNLASYFKRGTIEFRHFHSTTDPREITSWGMTVCGVIESANRLTSRQISVLPNNSRHALIEVVPTHIHPWIISQWQRMDAIIKDSPTYKANRLQRWGI